MIDGQRDARQRVPEVAVPRVSALLSAQLLLVAHTPFLDTINREVGVVVVVVVRPVPGVDLDEIERDLKLCVRRAH